MLLNIVSFYNFTTLPPFKNLISWVLEVSVRLGMLQAFLWCEISRMEAVVSALTQFIVVRIVRNVQRKAWPRIPNTTAFFQLLQANADSYSSTLPYSHGGFSCPKARWVLGCVSVCWAGVAWSLFIPGSQLTHEVMVVTLSLALLGWSLLSSAARSQMH